jgi:hypothetical protein
MKKNGKNWEKSGLENGEREAERRNTTTRKGRGSKQRQKEMGVGVEEERKKTIVKEKFISRKKLGKNAIAT